MLNTANAKVILWAFNITITIRFTLSQRSVKNYALTGFMLHAWFGDGKQMLQKNACSMDSTEKTVILFVTSLKYI